MVTITNQDGESNKGLSLVRKRAAAPLVIATESNVERLRQAKLDFIGGREINIKYGKLFR